MLPKLPKLDDLNKKAKDIQDESVPREPEVKSTKKAILGEDGKEMPSIIKKETPEIEDQSHLPPRMRTKLPRSEFDGTGAGAMPYNNFEVDDLSLNAEMDKFLK